VNILKIMDLADVTVAVMVEVTVVAAAVVVLLSSTALMTADQSRPRVPLKLSNIMRALLQQTLVNRQMLTVVDAMEADSAPTYQLTCNPDVECQFPGAGADE
jgi:hypothetical protein